MLSGDPAGLVSVNSQPVRLEAGIIETGSEKERLQLDELNHRHRMRQKEMNGVRLTKPNGATQSLINLYMTQNFYNVFICIVMCNSQIQL